MGYLIYNNSQQHITPEQFSVGLTQSGGNCVEIVYNENEEIVENISGFKYYTNRGNKIADYDDMNYIYRKDYGQHGYILCDDNTSYIEPTPEPEPEPYVPTLAEIQEAKVAEMNSVQQELISTGVSVELSNGDVEQFSLTSQDQTSLIGLQSQVDAGVEQIPWHNADQSDHCKYYTNADMAKIVKSAMELLTWHVTYYRDLRIYIRSLDNVEDVNSICYGINIPVEYQSQVLQDLISLINAAEEETSI